VLFGLIGYMFTSFKIPAAPFILGFILGRHRGDLSAPGLMLSKGSWSPFITKPISCFFILLSAFVIVLTICRELKALRSGQGGEPERIGNEKRAFRRLKRRSPSHPRRSSPAGPGLTRHAKL
jgi:TctA family transporter